MNRKNYESPAAEALEMVVEVRFLEDSNPAGYGKENEAARDFRSQDYGEF